ncbi:hypothetical protein [Neisseria lactamica]|nr:hypothetical protein [Neisseria lactamica]
MPSEMQIAASDGILFSRKHPYWQILWKNIACFSGFIVLFQNLPH